MHIRATARAGANPMDFMVAFQHVTIDTGVPAADRVTYAEMAEESR